MRPAERTKQGGSVLVYVVVAIVLGLLAVGAVYTVHKLGNNAEPSGEIAVETDEGSTDESDKSDKADSQSDNSDSATDSGSGADSQPDKSPTESGDAAPKTDQSTDDNTVDSEPTKPADKPAAEPKADKLPETGPADTLYSFGAISILSFAGASYIQSRRALN